MENPITRPGTPRYREWIELPCARCRRAYKWLPVAEGDTPPTHCMTCDPPRGIADAGARS